MKKKVVFLLLAIGASTFTFMKSKQEPIRISELCLQNVEALAEGEETLPHYACYGEGDVTCPNGSKAAVVVWHLSLD